MIGFLFPQFLSVSWPRGLQVPFQWTLRKLIANGLVNFNVQFKWLFTIDLFRTKEGSRHQQCPQPSDDCDEHSVENRNSRACQPMSLQWVNGRLQEQIKTIWNNCNIQEVEEEGETADEEEEEGSIESLHWDPVSLDIWSSRIFVFRIWKIVRRYGQKTVYCTIRSIFTLTLL